MVLFAIPAPERFVGSLINNFTEGVQNVQQHSIRPARRAQSLRTFIVILAPVVQLPVELEKRFVLLDHPLPTREQIQQIASQLVPIRDFPRGTELDRLLDAAAGLTRIEAENALALSLVRTDRLDPATLWELKAQALRKQGLLSLYRGGERLDELGGLTALKAFCLRALGSTRRAAGVLPRGVLLLGVPGTGKSAFAKALGQETGRPTVILDVGALMGSLVGQSEERIRSALRSIDALAPCVCVIDEVEKAFAGTGGAQDSGVTTRMFGTFLSWLSDHDSDVFVVCTANDISRLPPEFTRAERFDGTFFLDLPSTEQKAAIWQQYVARFQLDPDQRRPNDDLWTGAEIRACGRLAALLDLPLTFVTECGIHNALAIGSGTTIRAQHVTEHSSRIGRVAANVFQRVQRVSDPR
jgi:SpoVK/Ycf46/Vps4 family AAA+-type ATPase